MLIGYARVSTKEQDTHMQRRALEAAGVTVIFEEKRSGADRRRPMLRQALDALKAGDSLVVFKLDRVARSLQHLLEIFSELDGKGVGFRSCTEAIDTTHSAGRCMMQILGAFAEFERSIIRDRTLHGLAAARSRGVRLGRAWSIPEEQHALIVQMFREGATRSALARKYGVHVSSIKRVLRSLGEFRIGPFGRPSIAH